MLNVIYNENRSKIFLIYAVIGIEMSIFAIFPYMMGKSIDSLIAGSYFWFILYAAVFAAGLTVGLFRRMYDTRVFARIWKRCSCDVVSRMINKKREASKILTRANLSARFVDFFEFNLPMLARALISMAVSVVMIWLVSFIMGWVSFTVSFSAIVWSYFISLKNMKYDNLMQTATDNRNEAINSSDIEGVHSSYDDSVSCYIHQSDWQAYGWSVSDFLGMIVEMAVIFVLVRDNRFTVGEIAATVSYVWMLFGNVNQLSQFMLCLNAVKVAKNRIKEMD